MSSASWNPYNKVVQDPRDGTIDHDATTKIRQRLGLKVPWNPLIGEMEMGYPPAHLDLPDTGGLQAGLYKNKKNGHEYRVYARSFNATNAQNGQIMIHYRSVKDTDAEYSRELSEFREKFYEVNDDPI